MREVWMGGLCFSLALLLVAQAGGEASLAEETSPSLEFQPPAEEVVPEPKEKPPVPPLAIFQEVIGEFGISAGSFDGPIDVAAGKDGNLYVLDAGNERVQKFDRKGRFELEWGSFGSRKGEFDGPRAIAMDRAGYVYVVDTQNHRVQKFDTQGKFLLAWGRLGSRPGDFNAPLDITFDNDGNIFVLDAGNERVQKFNAAGKFLEEWGRFFGGRGGVFTDLVSLAWADDEFGYLYFLGQGSCLVQQFDWNGNLENSWLAADPSGSVCKPIRLEIDDENDYVYILDQGNSLLLRFRKDGRYLAAIKGGKRPFRNPMGLSINPERDEVYVADTGNHIVQKFSLR